ncbi:permease-like cell division protein FtsX [Vibrio breoganii]|uniref:Cell division protein FtsX n=1 Tax=Vibrio breoganii TaxID=553239 RepID=A0AAJ5EHC9_9VIBR|nr:permease-like cell division protein FtsX [Vibrio breoganii]ANO33989.1 cell division protein FtsX [Vibrio breoganii]MDN3717369.1 permease-like cell division protein FtsX [Vibrio breoganii]NMO75021.1 cell division protein FtsX [Vibrio breoganii]NMR71555.1 cell division protein FtsX [Vibrio breoganii]OCH72983.1 cell division protein FtsX [Vibrio breoganii]
MANKSSVQKIGYFRSHYLVAKGSLHDIAQRPLGNLFTLAVIAIVLALPSSLYVVAKNILDAAEQVSQPAAVSAYLQEGTPEARIMLIKDQLEGDQAIASVEYISSQQGLQDLSSHSGFNDAISLLDDYALPALLVIHPAQASDTTQQHILDLANAVEVFTDVRVDQDWLQRFDAIKALSSALALALACMMLVAVVLIIGNTMRFNVLARKEEIQVMKFLGATNSFILRPYLYTGMWFGLLGSLFAWLITLALSLFLGSTVQSVASLYDSSFILSPLSFDESIILLLIGSFLGLFAAQASARRHLSEIEPV